jgi:hypothetical protein
LRSASTSPWWDNQRTLFHPEAHLAPGAAGARYRSKAGLDLGSLQVAYWRFRNVAIWPNGRFTAKSSRFWPRDAGIPRVDRAATVSIQNRRVSAFRDTAPVSHQKRRERHVTNAIEPKRKHKEINEPDLYPVAHNGLVAGSSPAGPTNVLNGVRKTKERLDFTLRTTRFCHRAETMRQSRTVFVFIECPGMKIRAGFFLAASGPVAQAKLPPAGVHSAAL